MKTYVLYNSTSGTSVGDSAARNLDAIYPDKELIYTDVITINDFSEFISQVTPEDEIIVSGGDGTLNNFINNVADMDIKNPFYYYATGSGNDFLKDVGKEKGCEPFLINDYIKDLPIVTVKGKDYRFINGVGYGIDGYCCEVGDQMRATSTKPVNYTAIAIKGLLFYFKPRNATVIVDGKEYYFPKAWIAPTMHGRYYGGGMMCAPEQVRNNEEGTITFVTLYGTSNIRTLMIFPSIFEGKHIEHKKQVVTLSGKNITVKFDKPCTLQIDGETIPDVTEYTVRSGK